MKNTVVLVASIFCFIHINAQTWNLVWSDEFNGNAVDSTNWNIEVNDDGGWNNELQYYTNRPENVRVLNGNLEIEGKAENYLTRNYTSARLNSEGKRSWMHGKFEARIKLPYGNGIWPGFWLMGDVGNWPANGEIDIMEMVGGAQCGECGDNIVYGSAFWEANGTQNASVAAPTLSTGIYHDAFHLFSVEWDTTQIKWFVDGVQFTSLNVTNANQSEFHQPFYILLNLAIGGDWPLSPDSTTVWPQQLLVDYVRVYQLETISGLNTLESEELFRMFPNPTNNELTINTSSLSFGGTLIIYDAVGHELIKQTIEHASAIVDVSNLESGTYFVKYISDKGVSEEKIIIQ